VVGWVDQLAKVMDMFKRARVVLFLVLIAVIGVIFLTTKDKEEQFRFLKEEATEEIPFKLPDD
jgi:uncharacterized protein (DUF1015 family)